MSVPTSPPPPCPVHPEDPVPTSPCPSLAERRRRKRGRRGHRRNRHDARRRRFPREKRWRRGEPLRRRRRPRGGDGEGGPVDGGVPGPQASCWSPPQPLVRPGASAPSGRAFTLVELLVALAVLAVLATFTVPPLMRASADLRLRTAASQASRIFHLARSYAVRHSAHVGVKFHPGVDGAATTWTLHLDGDGDGVRTADVEAGVDPPVPAPGGGLHRHAGFHGARLGFPDGPLPRDPGGRRLTRRHDPIRFNRSDVASFGPLGTATPGSLYLTDGRGLAAVRVTGRSGRIRVAIYDAATAAWE